MTGVEALERALDDAHSDIDPIPAAELALAILRAEVGEGPMPELDDELPCICPPGLVERGGYRSGCPVHAPRVYTGTCDKRKDPQ